MEEIRKIRIGMEGTEFKDDTNYNFELLNKQKASTDSLVNDKGLFVSDTSLKAAYPPLSNKKGFFAFVGSKNPFRKWEVRADGGEWMDTGQDISIADIDFNKIELGAYVSKNTVNVNCIYGDTGNLSIVKNGNDITVSFANTFVYNYKTDNELNYLQPSAQQFICELSDKVSFLVIGLVFNYQDTGYLKNVRYGWYCINNDTIENKLSLKEDEVFAPVLVVDVRSENVQYVSGTLCDLLNKKKVDLGLGYNYHVTACSDITNNDVSVTKNTVNQISVNINKQIVYNTKTTDVLNYLYPNKQVLDIPILNGQTSIIQIGIVFNPITLKDRTDCHYDYYIVPNTIKSINPVLKEGEVFAPVLTLSDVSTNTPTFVGGTINDSILRGKIKSIESNTSNGANTSNTKKSNPLLYSIDFKNSNLSEWSNTFTTVTTGVQLKEKTFYWLKRLYRINKRAFEIDFNISTATKFDIYTHGLENGLAGQNTAFLTVDIANNALKLVYNNTTLNYAFTANRDYKIRVTQNDRVLDIVVIDLVSGIVSDSLSYVGILENQGLLYDSLCFYYESGVSPIFKKFTIYSKVLNPLIYFIGDSITVGYSASIVDGISVNSYAELTGDAMKQPYLVSGRGGGGILGFWGDTGYIGRLYTEVPVLRPNFVMITIGTNLGNSYADYKKIVEYILGLGLVPILNNIPMRKGANYIASTNAAINQIRVDYGISGARFDLVSSLNNNGVTFDDSLFIADKVHPNNELHKAMFERIKIDVPELFTK